MPDSEQRFTFLVQGSGEEAYEVRFILRGDTLNAFCTCPAGQNGTACKHRLGILGGSTLGILSNNTHDVKTLMELLPGTILAKTLDQLATAEAAAEKAKKTLASAKKAVARAMYQQ